tara:strand:- start:2318 stop:3517 length:1200 start_codon:yes stop_codon:yes gene_type:complete
MPDSFKNFFKTYHFKFYLFLILIFSILFLSQKFLYPTDWTTSEWLINYQGGFVRRGLIGELLYQIHNLSGIQLRYLVFYFEIMILIFFLILIYNFLKDISLDQLTIFLFFSPILLLFPLAENEVLVRKEYLLFSIYIIYLNLLLANNRLFYLVILVCLPVMNLVWDGMIFYIYFFSFSFFFKKEILTKEIKYLVYSHIPYFISLYFIIYAKSNPVGFDQMCLSINEACFGAMLALDKSLLWNINYVLSRFEFTYLIRYFFVILLCFSPIIIFSYTDALKIKIKNFEIRKPFFLINLILIFSIFLFMLIGYDWGRWINIGYFFSIFTFFFLIKNKNINIKKNYFFQKIQNFSKYYPTYFYSIFFIYVFSWNMKAIMTDDLGSVPYYRVVTKALKVLSSSF